MPRMIPGVLKGQVVRVNRIVPSPLLSADGMVHLTDDLAALIGFAGEAALWGAYTILFLVSIVLLHRRKETTRLCLPVVIAHIALYVACTVHYAIEFNHFYTTLGAKGVDGYANETTQLVGADIFISLCDLLGDYILIYRLWVLWGRNYWVVVLPSLCAVAGFACIMEVVHYVVALDPTSPTPPAPMLPLTIAGYALPLCTNALATAFIIVRIWWLSRPVPGAEIFILKGRGMARSAISTIVESGLLYFVAQLTYVITLSIPHPSVAIVAVMALQIYGIAPTLIIIRVMLGLSVETTTDFGPVTPMLWASKGYSTKDEGGVKYGVGLNTGTTAESGTKIYHTDGESLRMKPFETA